MPSRSSFKVASRASCASLTRQGQGACEQSSRPSLAFLGLVVGLLLTGLPQGVTALAQPLGAPPIVASAQPGPPDSVSLGPIDSRATDQDPAGQDASPPELADGTYRDEVSVRWVLVPVAVRSSSRHVRKLEVKDFRLSVDGRSIPIAAFDLGRDAPTSIVFLQDLSGSMDNGGKLEASRQALSHLLERIERRDELSLATFAGKRLAIEIPFSRSLEPFLDAMRAWRGYGTTTLHDAVAWLPDVAIDSRNGKRAVIIVTDGQDNASSVTPELARDLVRRADLPVYVIGLFLDQTTQHRKPPPGVTVPQLLNSLAYRSGGRYFEVTKAKQVRGAIDDILDDLRLRYVLSFPTSGQGTSEYHDLEVEVGRGSRYLLTYRRGYRGTSPGASPGAVP